MLAAVVAAVAMASPMYSKCLIPADDAHQEVDLNVLMGTSDKIIVNPPVYFSVHNTKHFTFQSKSSSTYSYHLNVCGETNLQNGGCSAGNSLCEVKDGVDGLDSYGFIDTITTAWEGDTLVIEDYYKCNVEIEYNTPIACGHAEKKYNCVANQCVADADGKFPSAADCLTGCGAPPPPPPSPTGFVCDDVKHMCVESAGGNYPSLDDCAKKCDAPAGNGYSCNGTTFQCVAKEGGQYVDQADCQKNCAPWVRHYQCYNGKCVRNSIGKFPSPDACQSVCGQVPASTWSCGPDNTCTEDEKGSYHTEAQCQDGCGSETLYACNDAKATCEVSNFGIADKATCDTACSGSATGFMAGPHGRHLPAAPVV
eukprot:gene13052-27901_t